MLCIIINVFETQEYFRITFSSYLIFDKILKVINLCVLRVEFAMVSIGLNVQAYIIPGLSIVRVRLTLDFTVYVTVIFFSYLFY